MNIDFNSILTKIYELLTVYGIKLLGAIAILVIGLLVAKIIRNVIRRVMERSKVDNTLTGFVSNLSYAALLAFVVVAALNKLGVQTASFIAVIGAAGLAIGLALQGSLANFAAGVLMIIFRPFKAGDLIEGAGTTGTVEEIQIFTTQLKTPDNKTIIIPNASMLGGNIINYSTKGSRRVDMVFGIGYEDDIDKARAIILDIPSKRHASIQGPGTRGPSFRTRRQQRQFRRPALDQCQRLLERIFRNHGKGEEALRRRRREHSLSATRDVHIYNHSD